MPSPDPVSPPSPGTRECVPQRVWARARGARLALRNVTLLAAAAGSLAACNSSEGFAPVCPQLALLRDGGDLTRFAGNGRDITDLVLDAHLTAVPANCKYLDRSSTKVQATLSVMMSLGRGPAMRGRAIDVPYFIAVTESDRVLDRQGYALRAEFPANADRITARSDPVTLDFPVSREKSAAAYQIWVSFQLTPEELAYNRGQTTP